MPEILLLEIDTFDRATFAIDIEGQGDFEPKLFDEQARAVIATGSNPAKTSLKFVVVGSTMALFSYDREHVDAYMSPPIEGYSGELACAGMASVRDTGRSIWGDSSSLERVRDFPVTVSNTFKLTVLEAALGEHFKIS